jgi:hypothetical protein
MKGFKLKTVLLLVLAFTVLSYFARDYFSMPDSKVVPPCPGGSERGSNGLDCKSKGDRYGL